MTYTNENCFLKERSYWEREISSSGTEESCKRRGGSCRGIKGSRWEEVLCWGRGSDLDWGGRDHVGKAREIARSEGS